MGRGLIDFRPDISVAYHHSTRRIHRLGPISMKWRVFIILLSAVGIVMGQLPVLAQTFLTYHCQDGAEFVVAFFERERLARLQLDGSTVVLSKRVSLSGLRYAKGDITLRITKSVTTLKRGKRLTECTAG